MEWKDERNASWFKKAEIKSIGVSAGASTPGWIIEQVVAKIHELAEN